MKTLIFLLSVAVFGAVAFAAKTNRQPTASSSVRYGPDITIETIFSDDKPQWPPIYRLEDSKNNLVCFANKIDSGWSCAKR